MFVGLTVAKNVGSGKHTINGTLVDVSFHPSTGENQPQETSADQVRLALSFHDHCKAYSLLSADYLFGSVAALIICRCLVL